MKLVPLLKHLFHPQRSNNHRPKFLHPKPLIFLSLIAVGFYQLTGLVATVHPISGSILGYASNISVDQVIYSTNTVRTGSGLGALTYNSQLSSAAVAKAQNMFSEGYWAHTSPTGREPWDFIKNSGYSYKVAGENLARDFDSTVPMVDAWMNSPTHRANIMNPRYQDIGVAVVDGLLNGVETTLVVQMFGTPDSSTVAKQPSVVVPAIATNTTVAGAEVQEKTVQPVQETIQADDQVEVEPVNSEDGVLAEAVVPQGELSNGILYSPQHILKAFFLSIIIILLFVLVYDALVAGHKDSVRFVGKNLAHVLLFIAVLYLVVAFKGGVVSP
ncbi:hypothetical protein KA017_04145 [Candidatus Woesebacteria bacterium]|nr:hypothetical protein [Candidatus Woesebacteria bacterium]